MIPGLYALKPQDRIMKAPSQIRFDGVSLFNTEDSNGFDVQIKFQRPPVLPVVDDHVSHFFAYRRGEDILREVGDLDAYLETRIKDVVYSVFRMDVTYNHETGFSIVHTVTPIFLKEDEADFFKRLKMVLIESSQG